MGNIDKKIRNMSQILHDFLCVNKCLGGVIFNLHILVDNYL